MRDVLVTGIGSTAFGRHAGTPIEVLAVRAAAAALKDGGIAPSEIGALYLGNFVSGLLNGKEVLAGIVAERLGLPNIPCTKVEGACASGGIAFRHAWLAVAFGLCDSALVVGAETMTHASTAQATTALNCALDDEVDGKSGITFPGLFGLAWRAYAEKYGLSRSEVSAVVQKNKGSGVMNPLAQMGAVVSAEEIESSTLIADPLRLFDCCPMSDGAAAVVLTAQAHAANRSVRVLSSVQTRGPAAIGGHKDLTSFEATVLAAARAYEQAGITAAQVDVVELHDCFSIAEIIDSEDLGLVPRGQGARWALEGRTALAGDIAINPSGGLLAKGHPVGATGVGQIYELVLQLRGGHSNQVPNARIGMAHNLGGTGVACTVTLLEGVQ